MNLFKIKKIIPVIILFLVLTIACKSKPLHLVVLHYNDFHGAAFPRKVIDKYNKAFFIGGSSHIAGYINKVRNENKYVLFLDAGDEFRGTPISDITKGKALFDILNMIKPDAFELGNHEFDYGFLNLEECIKKAEFPVLCSNITFKDDSQLPIKPYLIKDFGEFKVGIIGIITQSLKEISSPKNIHDIEVNKSLETLEYFVNQLKDKVNILIVLSHEDIEIEKEIARKIPGIDIMITGHDHYILNPPIKLKNKLIAQAGSNGEYIGRIDVFYDPEKGKIKHKEGTLIKTLNSELPEDDAVKKEIERLEGLLGKEFYEKIGSLEVPWDMNDRISESGAGNFEADVLRNFTGADIAFVNSGSVRKKMSPGPIKVNDVWELFPFDDEAYLYELSGKIVNGILEHNCKKSGDILQVSGLKYTFDSQKTEGQQLVFVQVGTELLNPDKI
ncbi:bifunctional metallophosphatase/5'-nucleotidase, partial [bacterium]|nr:bifunctional metallophosphatase/5'-nucleotidase [bacterium]